MKYSDSNAALIMNKRSIVWPNNDIIRRMKGNWGGIIIPELQYGFPNKCFFTPGYVVESATVRKIIRVRYLEECGPHFPIITYNDVPIYPGGIYPPWSDNLINNYLYELLHDGLIPVGSMFSDGSRTLKGNVDPDLMPFGFPGFENPTPIVKPVMDASNLFYVMRQAYPRMKIIWHKPVGQDLPYVNPPDWGATWDPIKKQWSDVNPQVWNYMVQSGCSGIGFQGRAWESNGESNSISQLNDYVERLVNGGDGWVKGDLYDMEEYIAYNTEQGAPQGLKTGINIRNAVPQLMGYLNG